MSELPLARKIPVSDTHCMQVGVANGCETRLYTNSETVLRVKPLLTSETRGVALIDEDGDPVSWSVRHA